MTERGIRMQFGIPHTFEIRDDFYLDDKKITFRVQYKKRKDS